MLPILLLYHFKVVCEGGFSKTLSTIVIFFYLGMLQGIFVDLKTALIKDFRTRNFNSIYLFPKACERSRRLSVVFQFKIRNQSPTPILKIR